jgi:hypothetical protein
MSSDEDVVLNTSRSMNALVKILLNCFGVILLSLLEFEAEQARRE